MIFEWNESKALSNLLKHKISFEEAILIWKDPLLEIRFDRAVEGEERWHAIDGVTLLLVVHTYPDASNETRARIVGARKATKAERKRYEDQGYGPE